MAETSIYTLWDVAAQTECVSNMREIVSSLSTTRVFSVFCVTDGHHYALYSNGEASHYKL